MAGLPYPAGVQAPKRYYTNWNVLPTIARPPWTTLAAYDLNSGTLRWNVPLGDDPELSPKGILNTGIRQEQRGIWITATGLIFVATSDGKLRALDEDSGKQIWSADLPAANRAVPAFYEVNGRENILSSAGLHVLEQAWEQVPARVTRCRLVLFRPMHRLQRMLLLLYRRRRSKSADFICQLFGGRMRKLRAGIRAVTHWICLSVQTDLPDPAFIAALNHREATRSR